MDRRRHRERFLPVHEPLERREVLSAAAFAPIHPVAGARPQAIAVTNFHRQYTRALAVRLSMSQQAAARLSQAFQLFEQEAFGLEAKLPGIPQGGAGTGSPEPPRFNPGGSAPLVDLPVGNPIDSPTTADLFNQLIGYSDLALSTFVERNNNIRKSLQEAPHLSPLAQQSLIPYAHAQIAEAAQVYTASPPRFDTQTGSLLNPEPRQAIERAFSNILNSVASYSVHPNLFLRPENFFVLTTYEIPFAGVPAKQASGFFLLGPGGVPLPGGGRFA